MTIYSMTGYAAGTRELGSASLHLELKSVNARFLDIVFRCGEELRFLEMPLREKLAAAMARGKVECHLNLVPQAATPRELTPNLALADATLKDFLATRGREGAKLAAAMTERLARMRELTARVAPLLPLSIADYETRLSAKLREAVAGLDEERIRQEIGLFATRIDVA